MFTLSLITLTGVLSIDETFFILRLSTWSIISKIVALLKLYASENFCNGFLSTVHLGGSVVFGSSTSGSENLSTCTLFQLLAAIFKDSVTVLEYSLNIFATARSYEAEFERT